MCIRDRPYIAEMARIADTFVSCYPNAGLPNAFGEYDESPEHQAGYIAEFAEAGLVNLVGGCCGTTPAHIAEIAKVVEGKAQRELPEIAAATRLSGLEPLLSLIHISSGYWTSTCWVFSTPCAPRCPR